MLTIKEFLEEKKEELESKMNDLSVDFVNDYEDNESDYISDCYADYADQQVSIYHSDLFEWVRNNYGYIEDYVEEFGIDDKNFDFIKLIQGGQWYYNYEQLNRDDRTIKQLLYINKMLNNLDYTLLQSPISKELEDSIEETLEEAWYDVDRFYHFDDIIKETFEVLKNEED